ncbi:MAG: class I SAM-dependent methyltransferase [Actinomycetota bacterium]
MSWTERLPAVGERRVAVRVTPDALRRIRGGHPWVYDRSIESARPDGSPGDLAVVFDRNRRFAAIGLWDPTSPIRLRILAVGDPVAIDAAWFAGRIADVARLRSGLLGGAPPGAVDRQGWRVVNGENDGLPGLVIDQYADTAVVKLYTSAWWPHLPSVVDGVVAATDASRVVLRLARNIERRPIDDGATLHGDPPTESVRFVENGLGFEADVITGQKTGHFLDQRHNRRRVRDLADGRRVLDVFSATGGFAVHAAAGGASSVLAVDRSEPTLAVAERNRRLNLHVAEVAACEMTSRAGDAFEVLDSLRSDRRTFDLVVVDPPSFTRRAADLAGALRAYGRLTSLALDVLEPGGVLVQASCSARVDVDDFHRTVGDAAASAGWRLDEFDRTAHDVDHPVSFPEGAYLKAGYWRATRLSGRR